MPAMSMYDSGMGRRARIPIIVDHVPVTISTANTKLILTIDMHTNPIVNRRIIDGMSDCTRPSDVPVTIANKANENEK